jgi:hypothetical protein
MTAREGARGSEFLLCEFCVGRGLPSHMALSITEGSWKDEKHNCAIIDTSQAQLSY